MKKSILCVLTAVAAVLTNGCFSPSVVQSKHYDLPIPEKAVAQGNFLLTFCANDSPSRTRMLYRRSNNQIVQDDYNCWIQPPEKMLTRYIKQALPVKGSSNRNLLAALRINISNFEFDLDKSEAVLALNYEIRQGSIRKNGAIMIREKADGNNAEAFSKAMSNAVKQAVAQLAAAVK